MKLLRLAALAAVVTLGGIATSEYVSAAPSAAALARPDAGTATAVEPAYYYHRRRHHWRPHVHFYVAPRSYYHSYGYYHRPYGYYYRPSTTYYGYRRW